MTMINDYLNNINKALTTIKQEEAEKLQAAADIIQTTIKAGGVIHSFGSGHSSLVAADTINRTGCPVPINQIIDKTDDMAERLNGYGATLLRHYEEQYGLQENDCLIVVSNSGRNPLPIEIAMGGRARGLKTIAICNVKQATSLPSRHESGKNLSQVADLVLDTHLPIGEASLALPNSGLAVAPISTFAGMLIMQSILLLALQGLDAEGAAIPIFVTDNGAIEDADERNAVSRRRYQGRLRRFGV